MARFGMVIDTRQCIGCQDCVVACNIENGVPPGQRREGQPVPVAAAHPDASILTGRNSLGEIAPQEEFAPQAGHDRLDAPLVDPVWKASWDFPAEAEVARRLRHG
mgnify:CR=1 FL=1